MVRQNFGVWFIVGALVGAALAVSLQRFSDISRELQQEKSFKLRMLISNIP